jgi:hypothetical protein
LQKVNFGHNKISRLQASKKLAIKNEETLLLSYGLLQDTMSEEFCNQIIGNGGPINWLSNNSKYVTTLTLVGFPS